MTNVLKEVSNENDRKTSEGEGGPRVRENDDNEIKQVIASNNKLQSSFKNQKLLFLGLLKGLFLKLWSQRDEMRLRHYGQPYGDIFLLANLLTGRRHQRK